MSDELTPITRKETFLAKAGGQNVETPTPITREETFLQAIIDNGSGGGGGGGTGGGTMVATATQSGAYVTLDKTWKELADAMESGIVPVVLNIDGTNKYKETVTVIRETSDLYSVSTTSFIFEVDTETGYPSFYVD